MTIRRLFGFDRDASDARDPASRAVRASTPALAVDPAPANPADAAWRDLVRRRALVVVLCLAVWVVAIEARLVHLQVVQHADLADRAERQQSGVIELPAMRGDIVDRHGTTMAYSVQAFSVSADPSVIDDPVGTARALCAILECPRDERRELEAKFAGDGLWAPVRQARQVSPAQTDRIRALNLRGIVLMPETRRYYPQSMLASQVVGFVGRDNAGLSGVESMYDSVIRGTGGVLTVHHDAHQRAVSTRVEQEPTPGATVELTIDLRLQHELERELKAGVEEHRAEGGTAIIMAPATGEILAIASYPSFNPNIYGKYDRATWKIPAFQNVYEPGSTFKIVTASAALEEGVLQTTDIIDCAPGYIKLPGRKAITDDHRYGELTFEDVIVKSSNVGAIRAGWRVGADRMARWMRRFGFGQTLVPRFAGESAGIVYDPSTLNDSALASVSMGYGVSVTPVQMVSAVSSIANGGKLMEPHLVRSITIDGRRQDVEPKVLRQTASPQTAAVMTSIMEEVVRRGTATAAKLDRYQIAGKTGTAKKAIPGGYSDTDRNSSFVGFVPSRRPEFAILVVIDTPRAGKVYGGAVAAPVFKRIAEAALVAYGVPPTINPSAPIVIRADAARPKTVERTAAVIPARVDTGGGAVMPDLRGLNAREAVRVLMQVGLRPQVSGAGVVVSQVPQPGEALTPGRTGVVQLRRLEGPSGGGR